MISKKTLKQIIQILEKLNHPLYASYLIDKDINKLKKQLNGKKTRSKVKGKKSKTV